ncbi:uncharacterized protein LOC130733752 [Lotus japonicus]|uniref:uncharacterized protein LOC130733752 n=1 Tax=Lotus japonicus TaxID=34305 RepID=UPI00258AEE36|nr:uncharacterized protein LOC130733752 [Lotus japonicus]
MEVESEGSGAQQQRAPPAGKPPENLGRKPTFKEKVLGARKASETEEFVNLVTKGVMKMDYAENNTSFPMFSIEPTMYREICKPWEDCLVVKLLGKHIGYGALCEKLKSMWKLTGGYEIRDVHHGYFLVKFDKAEDKARAISGAPWLIYDHYLAVKPWTRDFVAANSKISTTKVWIRIPGLGFQFCDKNILLTLASAVETPIKIDLNTNDIQCGKYARICVEIDLTKPVLGVVGLEGTWYQIEYEGLHLLCHQCGCYGHLARNCTMPVSSAKPGPGGDQAAMVVPQKASIPGGGESGIPAAAGQNLALETLPRPVDVVGQGGVNPAVIPAQLPKPLIKCPELAHGEWLVVDKRKKKVKDNLNLNSNQKKNDAVKELVTEVVNKGNKKPLLEEQKKGNGKGNKSKPATVLMKQLKHSTTAPMQFKARAMAPDVGLDHTMAQQTKK